MSYFPSTPGISKTLAITPGDLRQQHGRRAPRRESAEAWLKNFLGNGPRQSREVVASGEAEGMQRHILYRAAAAVGVVIKDRRWSLPPGDKGQGAA
jgi:hypothetical protein